MLTLEQCLRVKYPWQSFDYEDSEHWMKIALKFMEAASDAAEEAQKVAHNANSLKHGGTTVPNGSLAPDGSPASGYGSISGPGTLRCGSTATYKLYVGGKLVNADWSQGGTSISVYGSGDHARAMGGNPPIKSGKYRTSIRAKYNGKTYSKTIYIQK